MFHFTFKLPGAGMRVACAALGTALAECITGLLMLRSLLFTSTTLKLQKDSAWKLKKDCIWKALCIAAPVGLEHALMSGAMVITTRIVAPLGTVSIAANSFAVTAESLCYMPGYGIEDAATTLMGQSVGAGRRELVKRFSRITVILGMAVMAITVMIMFLQRHL